MHRFNTENLCSERMGGWNISHVYRLQGPIAVNQLSRGNHCYVSLRELCNFDNCVNLWELKPGNLMCGLDADEADLEEHPEQSKEAPRPFHQRRTYWDMCVLCISAQGDVGSCNPRLIVHLRQIYPLKCTHRRSPRLRVSWAQVGKHGDELGSGSGQRIRRHAST
jgi:hypothetical protein